MKIAKITITLLLIACLTACVSQLLFGNKMQSKLMWALIKPLVGFDPNQVNFFETPMVKDRMTSLLGDKYEPTMKLLRTANEIRQEGALFYVLSNYGPKETRDIADKAGLVWNSNTNQMAVMLVQNNTPQILSEQNEALKQAITPVLPKEMQVIYEQAAATKRALDEQKKKIENLQKNPLGLPAEPILQLPPGQPVQNLPATPELNTGAPQ
jgi:hypothetical protein